jgi:outer membrane protein OmpA-like peptidoglycan-associated protein
MKQSFSSIQKKEAPARAPFFLNEGSQPFFGDKDRQNAFFQKTSGQEGSMLQLQPSGSQATQNNADANLTTACDTVSTSAADKSGNGILFGNNSSILTPDAKKEILKFAAGWKSNGSSNEVLLDGYSSTAGQGSELQRRQYNLKLSCDRALSVKKEMAAAGITASLIHTTAHGESNEFGGFDENRRVQYKEKITKPQPPSVKAQDPVFSITGNPTVQAIADGNDITQSTLQVVFLNGDFSIDAVVNVQTQQASDADDWQVGITQMVGGPVSHACYSINPGSTAQTDKQHAGETFVDALNAPGIVHPDRDSDNTVFMHDDFKSGVDLKSIHQGNLFFPVKLHSEDHPSTRAKGSASALGATEAGDSHSTVSRTVRFGLMITNIVARQISTERIIPLFTAEWLMHSKVDYIFPGGGIAPQVQGNPVNIFKLLKQGPSTPADFPPVVKGKRINELQQTSRKRSWEKKCPDI